MDAGNLGMEELSRIKFVIPESSLALVSSQLDARLREHLAKVPPGKEEKFYFSAINASEAVEATSKYKSDLRIYMECCAVANSFTDDIKDYIMSMPII